MIEPVLLPTSTIRDAIDVIEQTRRFIAAVVDGNGKLLGIISDGDIRRSLLADKTLDDFATVAMTEKPILGQADDSAEVLQKKMLELGVAALPLVDECNRFVRIAQVNDETEIRSVASSADLFWGAVVMAGGEGRRLRPLTDNMPKPMLTVGGVPLLERQIRGMVSRGLKRIFISTNYLGHLIEDHFGDGSDMGARIAYLKEDKKLGTAGALSLLPESPDGPILVINGDVLTTSDYGRMLDFHDNNSALMTVAAIEYHIEIPFGVIETSGVFATALQEKPSQSYLCNAGMYVLSPKALELIPKDGFFNMTDVIDAAIAIGEKVSVFPVHEYWTDIGSPSDLAIAQKMFGDR
ncbi:nucleotidyltransferase family protein [Methylophaga sp.]|uniref:nucleotidyltransferase family protein n=1 Tax=Methylophaga sp. TaxID=2024840 RepID=UPI003A930B90